MDTHWMPLARPFLTPWDSQVRAKVVKNKVGPPYREANLDIRFGLGVDEYGALFDAAELCGVIERRGSYYHFGANNENLAQVCKGMHV